MAKRKTYGLFQMSAQSEKLELIQASLKINLKNLSKGKNMTIHLDKNYILDSILLLGKWHSFIALPVLTYA